MDFSFRLACSLMLLMVTGHLGMAQDSPATASSINHRWSYAIWQTYDMVGLTDDPTSASTHPDHWMEFIATNPDVEIMDGEAAWEVELIDSNLSTLASGTGASFSYSGLTVGSSYYLSVAVPTSEGDDPILVALVDNPFGCLGDYDGNGAVNNSDLLQFLANFGNYGRWDQDYNQDEVVNVLDLLQHIPAHGDLCEPEIVE